MLEAEETPLGPLFSFSAKTSESDQSSNFLGCYRIDNHSKIRTLHYRILSYNHQHQIETLISLSKLLGKPNCAT